MNDELIKELNDLTRWEVIVATDDTDALLNRINELRNQINEQPYIDVFKADRTTPIYKYDNGGARQGVIVNRLLYQTDTLLLCVDTNDELIIIDRKLNTITDSFTDKEFLLYSYAQHVQKVNMQVINTLTDKLIGKK